MLNITEVRVKLMEGRSDRLRAFCSMTVDDDFVVHDLRVIEGKKGKFVAMPSRKLSDSCPQCGGKNHLRASYCNDCGAQLDEDRAEGRKLHVDVAHPINTPCREHIQEAVLEAYEEDVRRKEEGKEPNHIFLEDDLAALEGEEEEELPAEEADEAEAEAVEEQAAEVEKEETAPEKEEEEEEAEKEEERAVPSRGEPAEEMSAEEAASTPSRPQQQEKAREHEAEEEEEKEEEAEKEEEEEDEFYKGIF